MTQDCNACSAKYTPNKLAFTDERLNAFKRKTYPAYYGSYSGTATAQFSFNSAAAVSFTFPYYGLPQSPAPAKAAPATSHRAEYPHPAEDDADTHEGETAWLAPYAPEDADFTPATAAAPPPAADEPPELERGREHVRSQAARCGTIPMEAYLQAITPKAARFGTIPMQACRQAITPKSEVGREPHPDGLRARILAGMRAQRARARAHEGCELER